MNYGEGNEGDKGDEEESKKERKKKEDGTGATSEKTAWKRSEIFSGKEGVKYSRGEKK